MHRAIFLPLAKNVNFPATSEVAVMPTETPFTAAAESEGEPTRADSATFVTVKKILNEPVPALPFESEIVNPT